jgi:hypothetical protein
MHAVAEPNDEVLEQHHVLIRSDNAFQRRARLLQSLWRERHELPIGMHGDRLLGSRLAMPFAQESLSNYLTENTRQVVRAELRQTTQSGEKLFSEPRIYDDLLSSQPLCFNLFAELQCDLKLATRVFSKLLGDSEIQVQGVTFEYSPGRGDARFTADRSAFDVFVTYQSSVATRGFVGIEVKYAENMAVAPARHRPRYDEVADAMGVFRVDARATLKVAPVEQLWRDHLLAGSLRLDTASGFSRGTFAVVYPSANTRVVEAVTTYRACLSDPSGFATWTLEDLTDAINKSTGKGAWIGELCARYLGSDAPPPPLGSIG